jgi:hypothetical protein
LGVVGGTGCVSWLAVMTLEKMPVSWCRVSRWLSLVG